MARASLTEIIPDKLYQRGQFLTWPYKQKQRVLREKGVTLVVNLWSKIDADLSPEDLDRIYISWHTSPSQVPPDADAMVETIVQLLRRGHVALIHCEAGRGRSLWLCARVVAAWENITGGDALKSIEDLAPYHNLTPTLRSDLLARTAT